MYFVIIMICTENFNERVDVNFEDEELVLRPDVVRTIIAFKKQMSIIQIET